MSSKTISVMPLEYLKIMITVEEIAKKAGVPVKTASRALAGITQGKRRDARERAERVLKIARELGYQPSHVAKALRKGKTRTIGMVVGGLGDKYFGCLIEAFLDELDKYGYRLLLEVTKWDWEKEYECLKDLLQYRVDGIIYLCDLPETLRVEHRMMKERRFPLMTITTNDHGFGSVKNDFTEAIHSAVNFLYNRKHHDIGVVLPFGRKAQHQEIEKIIETECADLGIEPTIYNLERGNDVTEVIKKRHGAWLINGHHTQNRILRGFAEADSGYKPDVIGFYDDFCWEHRVEGICGAIFSRTGEIIEQVVKEIIARIENESDIERADILLSAEFVQAEDFALIKVRETLSEYNT